MHTIAKTAVRWLIRRDFVYVLGIEEQVFPDHPWSHDDFVRVLRQRNCIGMVAEREVRLESANGASAYQTQPVGYMVYELHKNRLHLLNFAVHPKFHRSGIGRAMVDKLITKLSPEKRNRILLEVRETNLDAQLFFKAMGFRAISVLRDHWDDSDESAYLMQRRCEPAAEVV